MAAGEQYQQASSAGLLILVLLEITSEYPPCQRVCVCVCFLEGSASPKLSSIVENQTHTCPRSLLDKEHEKLSLETTKDS